MEVNVRDKKIAQKHNMLTDVFRYRKYCISLNLKPIFTGFSSEFDTRDFLSHK